MLSTVKYLISQGHSVDIVVNTRIGALRALVPKEVRIIDLGVSKLRYALIPLIRYLLAVKPDAAHAQMWPLTVVAIVARFFSRSDTRLLISDQVALSQHMKGWRQALALRITVRIFYPYADTRVICSEGAANDLCQFSGLPRSAIEVITNPIEPPDALSSNEDVENLWGAAEGRLISVGNLKSQKNHVLLLKAFAASSVRPSAKLMILGDGPLNKELKALATELKISDRVIFPGFDNNPWPYLASADVFVLSSNYEGFPLALVEAMYAGLRLISTDCASGPSEILLNGRFGRLVPCNDIKALTLAIDEVWSAQHDPVAQRSHALNMAGKAQISRYIELLTKVKPQH